MRKKAKINIRGVRSPWVEDQLPLADVVMHERRDEPNPEGYWQSKKSKGPVLNSSSAFSPATLSLLINSIMPKPLGKREEVRGIEWKNLDYSASAERSITLATCPVGLRGYDRQFDGLTVIQAETAKLWVGYIFPTITDEDQFPRVEVGHGFIDEYGQRGTSGSRERDYADSATGIGALVTALLNQTNEVLVLEQEDKDFMRK